MADFKFPAVLNEGDAGTLAVVTAFNADSDTPVYTADERHPHFAAILEGLRSGDSRVWSLFDVVAGVTAKFASVTDRVSFDGENVLWDGDPVHSVLAEQLRRSLENGTVGEDAVALAKFWEKLESNPSKHSREQAYDFLAAHSFQITPEGDVVGFKGVESDGIGGYQSTAASTVSGKPSAFVDGVPIKERSKVPNKVGSTVTMPRSEVVHDPRQACRRGLHVSTRGYAESYGRRGTILEVHVNPRDIVSVPTDGGGEKVRVCRYVIARDAVSERSMGSAPVLRENKDAVWAGDVGYRV